MSSDAQHTPRKRGRPRKNAAADSRALIVAAAHDEFVAKGFEGASLRAIARTAGVDPALVHHYFADKTELLTEALDIPLRPDVLLPRILATPEPDRAAALVRFILSIWDDPNVQKRGTLLLRTAFGQGLVSHVLREFLSREIFSRIAGSITGEEAELRAQLVATQLVGLIALRFVLRVEPLASAPADEIVRRVAPAVDGYLSNQRWTADGLSHP